MLFKYPSTYHLPWSEGVSSDDKVLKNINHLIGKEIVITEKLDGENTTIYKNFSHARSVDSKHHISRDWVKQFAATFQYNLPDNWRICGENLFAKHSIYYDQLSSYFYGFSVWNDSNMCLAWDDTIDFFNKFNIVHVPIIARFILNDINDIYDKTKEITDNLDKHEGYVIRIADSFTYDNFKKSVAKFVRKSHVNTDNHWMYASIIKNKLR
jgi:hypothetical protein